MLLNGKMINTGGSISYLARSDKPTCPVSITEKLRFHFGLINRILLFVASLKLKLENIYFHAIMVYLFRLLEKNSRSLLNLSSMISAEYRFDKEST